MPGLYSELRNLTVRIEHISNDAQEAGITGLFESLKPGEIKQSRMRLLRAWLVRLFATLRGLESMNLQARSVELKQSKSGFPDGRTAWPEDYTDVEQTEDDDLLARRMQDVPLSRVMLGSGSRTSRVV